MSASGSADPASLTTVREAPVSGDDRVDWWGNLPFFLLHLACLAIVWVGVSPLAVGLAIVLYAARMFAITGFYHRYFSHRTFKTHRFFQFAFAVAGATAIQRGPLWWAAHHRHHHAHSDQEDDVHSPLRLGFWKSHMGWFLTKENARTQTRLVRDWMRYPELVWLDRFHWVPGLLLAGAIYAAGSIARGAAPELGTSGPQLLVWFLVSTVALYHGTYTINSLSHQFGSRRFATTDDSRNNALLAIVTLGEGWHNNHHHYPSAARQGFYWYEFDPTYYGLKVLSWLRIVRDLRPVPEKALARNRIDGQGAGP